jgi:hypothetical protein
VRAAAERGIKALNNPSAGAYQAPVFAFEHKVIPADSRIVFVRNTDNYEQRAVDPKSKAPAIPVRAWKKSSEFPQSLGLLGRTSRTTTRIPTSPPGNGQRSLALLTSLVVGRCDIAF